MLRTFCLVELIGLGLGLAFEALKRGFHRTQRSQRKQRKQRDDATTASVLASWPLCQLRSLRLLRTFLRPLRTLRWMESLTPIVPVSSQPFNRPGQWKRIVVTDLPLPSPVGYSLCLLEN